MQNGEIFCSSIRMYVCAYVCPSQGLRASKAQGLANQASEPASQTSQQVSQASQPASQAS